MAEEDLFQLHNGRYILDESISEKMRFIKSKAPERIQQDTTGYTWDESGMAELFSECYINDTRYCPEAKSWYTYSAGAWRKDTGALLVSEKIKEFCRIMLLYCGEIVDEETRKQYIKFVSKMGDRRFRDRMMKDAASVYPIPIAEFDADPFLINCKNGTYDLRSMTFREHNWKDKLTMQTNFDYTVQDVRCERWEQFISEVTEGNADKAEYLQKAIGYSMLGTANEECMFILHGKTTRNGKSTLLSAIHHLLGDYASVSPVSIICKTDRAKNAEAANPVLAGLKGKRFVTMAESNQYGKLDEEVIKQLTGGEEIKTRNLYESASTWLPQFTLWLSCNDLPSVSDKSLFASDRIRVIEFTRHFQAAEQDKNLKTVFQSQEAMQGIFTWMLAGFFKYKRYGLTMPEEMQKVVEKYERDNDLVLQFLEDRCERRTGETIKRQSLYDSYKMWCRTNGYYSSTLKRFCADLDVHPEWHDGSDVVNDINVYKGIGFKAN